jgi:hypothetical protein
MLIFDVSGDQVPLIDAIRKGMSRRNESLNLTV